MKPWLLDQLSYVLARGGFQLLSKQLETQDRPVGGVQSLWTGRLASEEAQDLDNWEASQGHCGYAQLQAELRPWKVEGQSMAIRALEVPK